MNSPDLTRWLLRVRDALAEGWTLPARLAREHPEDEARDDEAVYHAHRWQFLMNLMIVTVPEGTRFSGGPG